MTDELIKKADLYANNTRFTEYDNPSLSESLDISEEIKQAYIAGAKEYEQKFIDMNKTYQDLINGWVNDYRELEKENEQLKNQIERMKCCANCDCWDYLSTGERDCPEADCNNRSHWRFRDRG